jgi:hypothetical protein
VDSQLSFESTFAKIEAHFFSEIFSRDLEKFGGDRFSDEQSRKNGDLSHILEKI